MFQHYLIPNYVFLIVQFFIVISVMITPEYDFILNSYTGITYILSYLTWLHVAVTFEVTRMLMVIMIIVMLKARPLVVMELHIIMLHNKSPWLNEICHQN